MSKEGGVTDAGIITDFGSTSRIGSIQQQGERKTHKQILKEMEKSYDTLEEKDPTTYQHEEQHLKIDNQRLKMKAAHLPSHIAAKERRP